MDRNYNFSTSDINMENHIKYKLVGLKKKHSETKNIITAAIKGGFNKAFEVYQENLNNLEKDDHNGFLKNRKTIMEIIAILAKDDLEKIKYRKLIMGF